jgi:hypothetical protein
MRRQAFRMHLLGTTAVIQEAAEGLLAAHRRHHMSPARTRERGLLHLCWAPRADQVCDHLYPDLPLHCDGAARLALAVLGEAHPRFFSGMDRRRSRVGTALWSGIKYAGRWSMEG